MEKQDEFLRMLRRSIANGDFQQLEVLVSAAFADEVKSHLMKELDILEDEFLYGRGTDSLMVGVVPKGLKL